MGEPAAEPDAPPMTDNLSFADRRFRDFHRDNPEVYEELMVLVRQAMARGRKKIGIKMLWEVVRWNRFLRTTDEKYKLNNNYHSVLDPAKDTECMVAAHRSAPGYLFKKYTDESSSSP